MALLSRFINLFNLALFILAYQVVEIRLPSEFSASAEQSNFHYLAIKPGSESAIARQVVELSFTTWLALGEPILTIALLLPGNQKIPFWG